MATRKVGRKPLRMMSLASSIESRNSESAEINVFSIGRLWLGKPMRAIAAPIMHAARRPVPYSSREGALAAATSASHDDAAVPDAMSLVSQKNSDVILLP